MSAANAIPATPARNFVEHAGALARTRGAQVWLRVVDGRSADAPRALTYAALDERARALAALLQQRSSPGARALLMFDNDEHYAVALLACFYSGVIAVPVLRPRAAQPQQLQRLASIAADARAHCMLTTSAHAATARQLGRWLCIEVDTVPSELAEQWQPCVPGDNDIAFLQYTSGSTATPKGVMVTHGNLMANQRALQHVLALRADEYLVSWQPLYHDMGLIGGLLHPLYVGAPLVLTSPEYFLERPSRWLELMTRYRAVGAAAPDFAYRLCVERIKSSQVAQFDLSAWRVALSGAEPIRNDTVQRFCAKFGPAGFDPRAFRPCYGLAEATLVATATRAGSHLVTHEVSSGASLREVVSCGVSVPEHEVRIVDPTTWVELPEGTTGEIWLRGPSITRGYWAQPQSTAETFVAWRGTRWLRTGDLGLLRAGQLYVAGRHKDLIIVRGHNVYPHDVEQAIEAAVPEVREGRVAAFAVALSNGVESLGVAAEIGRGEQHRSTPQALVEAVSSAAADLCGEPPAVVVLLNPGALPRTSSGKLRRGACRVGCSERTLDAYAWFEQGRCVQGAVSPEPAAALDEMQSTLAVLWREVLQWDADFVATPQTHFLVCGGNSLSAVQAAQRIAARWDVAVSAATVFEHPRLADLAHEIQRRLASGQRRVSTSIVPLPRTGGALPLAPAQQRQWFLWQLDRQGSAYHVNVALRVRGSLQLDALRMAWHAVGMRHEALRSVFKRDAAGAVGQYVLPQFTCQWEVLAAAAEVALTVVAARAREPFDLSSGPLVRVTVVKVAQQQWLLALTVHHIVSDAASMQIVISELLQEYCALTTGATAARAVPRIQYADYAAWQCAWLASGAAGHELEYWRQQLAGTHPLLALTTDQPRRALAHYRAATHVLELPHDLLATLRRCAQLHEATLFMTLLAGFAALLHRYTAQEDLRIGVPVANRQHPETAALVGLFVNTLVMRLAVPRQMSWSELLGQVRATALAAHAHAQLPFEQLVEALQPQRSLSHSPLFQVMFNHVQEDLRGLQPITELDIEVLPVADSDAQFELMLDVRERSDGTAYAVFTYAAELFEPRTIARMAGHYAALLGSLCSDAKQSIATAQYLSSNELAPVQAVAAQCDWTPVHMLIAARAQAAPQSVALLFEEQSISHCVLQRWSKRIAIELLHAGATAESRVAVRLERGPAAIAALLACWQAGAVYVPLDPRDPPARMLEILQDSRARVLITDSQTAVAPRAELQILRIDPQPIDGPDARLNLEIHANSLAYLIYTSGTTGQPKAVAVEHGALARHVQAMLAACDMTAQDRMLQFAPVHVDAALEQSLVPLAAGAALVLQRHWSSLAGELEALCTRHGISVLDLPPAYARQLLQNASGFAHAPRLVVCGGEPWRWEDLHLLRRVLRPQQLINAYGPTEAVITPTLWRAASDAVDEHVGAYVPIGRPVGTRHVHVLDAQLQPVPEGVPGELHLGGEHALARGYFQRAALTAERFIADPSAVGGRLYRTGDLVRWREHPQLGRQLEYLQRLDGQLKLRGLRIEPGEIEAQLERLPEVQQAVVTMRAQGEGLVAYVVPSTSESLDGLALRRQLQAVLPDYMLPTIMVLPRLPLTPAGKIDYRALPAAGADETSRPVYAAPCDPTTQWLAELWSGVLGVQRIGLHDNFFELGGNSLLLMQLHALLEQRCPQRVTLTDLFKFPTLATLAQHLDGVQQANTLAQSEQRATLKRNALRLRAHLARPQ